jgi:Ca-activated chloride channel family protein
MTSVSRRASTRTLAPLPPAALVALTSLLAAACGTPYKTSGPAYVASSPSVAAYEAPTGEVYAPRTDNAPVVAAAAPISTFSIDVDTASYANVRRLLHVGSLPPPDAVRAEELINAFSYRYELPTPGGAPVALSTELAASPFHPGQRLLRLGLATAPLADAETPPRNLVFLVDTSGSMATADKLPLLLEGLRLLVHTLRPIDRVAIVAYAGSAGAVLPPTPGDRKAEILDALGRLGAGGSTNGGAGIELAYRLAQDSFDRRVINRVILCTDGDFNVGVSSQDALVELISARRATGVYLTVMGFGTGNLKDATMESLAQHGNGNYGYVDTLAEARKLLVEQAGGTLLTVAKDVKVQVAFDPARVASYRLIGYENRLLSERDFADDQKDAGELGAGHRVTALYELALTDAAPSGGALLTARVRGQREPGTAAVPGPFELEAKVADSPRSFASASPDLRFAAAVAGFAMNLRGAASAAARGDVGYRWARDTALAAITSGSGAVISGERSELVELIELAARLSGAPLPAAAQVATPVAAVAR